METHKENYHGHIYEAIPHGMGIDYLSGESLNS